MNEHLKNSFYFLLKKEIHVIFMNLSVKTFAQGKILVYFYAYAVKKVSKIFGEDAFTMFENYKKSLISKSTSNLLCQKKGENFGARFQMRLFGEIFHHCDFFMVVNFIGLD